VLVGGTNTGAGADLTLAAGKTTDTAVTAGGSVIVTAGSAVGGSGGAVSITAGSTGASGASGGQVKLTAGDTSTHVGGVVTLGSDVELKVGKASGVSGKVDFLDGDGNSRLRMDASVTPALTTVTAALGLSSSLLAGVQIPVVDTARVLISYDSGMIIWIDSAADGLAHHESVELSGSSAAASAGQILVLYNGSPTRTATLVFAGGLTLAPGTMNALVYFSDAGWLRVQF
jgi:hypothetical protein